MRRLTRLARMGAPELRFRVHGLARDAAARLRLTVGGAHWDRVTLSRRLAGTAALTPTLMALRNQRWMAAHEQLALHFASRPPRFLLNPADMAATAATIVTAFPAAREASRRLADPIVGGHYRLLGYDALDFGRPPDWHLDPVHRRRSPRRFWSDVPYLDPQVGDHKIIWELNRHQHWLVLGRAWWLTGDARYRGRVVSELLSWLAANPPLIGINWSSMLELALRCLSWTWALHFFVHPPERRDQEPWLVDLLVALDVQLAHVEQHLSYYFSPNTHLLGEGLALYVCGQVFPELAASPRRAAVGRAVLLDGAQQQIDSDGGHRERSTHYHRYTLDFYVLALAIARITQDPAAPRFALAVEQLAAAARLLADRRGHLPQLGDDDGGMMFPICGRPPDDVSDSLFAAAALTGCPHLSLTGPSEESLWMLGHGALQSGVAAARAAVPKHPATSGALPATGYFISRSPAGDHAVIDGGPHGFLNGGHAHADALSLTLSVGGHPLLIDTGTATYVDVTLRDRFRSSLAHNTLTLDGRSPSQPAGPFHWAQTTDARVVRWQVEAHFDYFEGIHDGYAPQVHRRHVLAAHGDLLVVADCVAGSGRHRADLHWHVHPDWSLAQEDRIVVARSRHGTVQIASTVSGLPQLFRADEKSGLGWYSPIYGRVEPLTTVRLSDDAVAPFWVCTVFGLDVTNAVTAVAPLVDASEAGGGSDGGGFRIHRARSVDDVVFRWRREPRSDGAAIPLEADPPAEHGWRLADYASDARLLFCRRGGAGAVQRLLLVDAEHASVAGPTPVDVRCAQPVRGMQITLANADPTDDTNPAGSCRHTARVSSAPPGLQLRVAGRPQTPVEDRRAVARATAEGVH